MITIRLVLLVIMLLIISQVKNEYTNNVWSLHYLWYVTAYPQQYQGLPPVPLTSDSASVWLAQEALGVGDIEQAQTLLAPLVVKENIWAISMLGDILEVQSDLEEAFQIWSGVGNLNRITKAAEQATEEGNLDDALLGFKVAHELEPQKGVLPLASFLWNSIGDHFTAETMLREALNKYPASPHRTSWRHHLGDYAREQERWQEAETFYKQVLKERRGDLHTWIDLGWLYYERGDGLEAATEAMGMAVAFNPQRGYGYFAMAQLLAKAEDYDDADRWFEQAIERNQQARSWYVARVNAARQAGNLPLALTVYEEIVVRFPNNPQTYYELAWIYRLNEQPKEAITAIEKALQLLDKPEELYYVRAGKIYEWHGNVDAAIGYYRLILAQNPENRAALSGLQRLEGGQ